MIDIENSVFNRIVTALRNKYSSIFVTGEKVAKIQSYPCVTIVEADNYTYARGEDSSLDENFAKVMYEVQVLSNKTNGKKTECKNIFSVIDAEFTAMGFIRKTKQPIPMDDAKTYQLVGRYEAVVSKNHTIFRR